MFKVGKWRGGIRGGQKDKEDSDGYGCFGKDVRVAMACQKSVASMRHDSLIEPIVA